MSDKEILTWFKTELESVKQGLERAKAFGVKWHIDKAEAHVKCIARAVELLEETVEGE